jgi:hypothetical protein
MLKSIVEFVAGLSAAGPIPPTPTITGRVVSLAYYGENKARPGGGLDQKLSDARASVKWEGMPAGIVTSDGTAYQIAGGLVANNNAKIIEFLGQTVTVTGDVSETNGILVISANNTTVVGKEAHPTGILNFRRGPR